ncbi:unnamed protein product [Paramecium sonneborni]|uniref:Protein kinase domain-containing protein n=1 Tax=Paramecium sonneborni TaxID=65129 RepID=A0A8S1M4L4_9CILI|nr:unnamed protein product [Paramecium sonneborni]
MQNVQVRSPKKYCPDQTYKEYLDCNQFKIILNNFVHPLHHKQWNHQPRLTEIKLNYLLTIMFDGNLVQEYCILYPNVLRIGIHNIQLSQYQIKKQSFLFNNNTCYLITLDNDILLLFKNEDVQLLWYYQMKEFSILKLFYLKFQLEQQLFQDFYKITNKKQNNEQLSAYFINKQQPYLEQTFGLLHESRHPAILQVKGIYEDQSNYIVVTDYYEGEPLFNALINGLQLNESQIASVFYQILILLRYLHDHEAYHGNLNALNVLINQETINMEIQVIGFVYYPFKQSDEVTQYWDWVSQFQYKSGQFGQIPGIHCDLYQLGVLLYMITFFKKNVLEMENKNDYIKMYIKYMSDFRIDHDLINLNIDILTGRIQMKLEMKTPNENYFHVFSLSQLDFIRKLLCQCSLMDAISNQWFINTQQKCKSQNQRQGTQNLKTIIEQREFSDEEQIKSQTKRNSVQSENSNEIDEYPIVENLIRNIIDYEKAPCKTHHC